MSSPRITHSHPPKDLAETLRRDTAWARAPAAAVEAMIASGRPIQARRGDALAVETGVVLAGVLAVQGRAIDGRQALAQLLHAGDVIDLSGETPQFGEGPQRLTALTPATVLALPAEPADQTSAQAQALQRAWIDALRRQTAALRRRFVQIAFKTPVERLAAALLDLRGWPEACDGEKLILPFQYSDLSEYLAMKPETVSRALRRLLEEGAIEIEGRGRLALIDLEQLQQIAAGGRPRAAPRQG